MATATSEAELLDAICATAVDELGYVLAWIGLVDDGGPRVRPVAHAGYEAGYLDSIVITWSDDEAGAGPTGRAIRTHRPTVAQDIATDPRFEPWRADALARGYGSSVAIPMCLAGTCLGALNLYAAEPAAFDDDEIALLEEVATDLALGLARLRDRARLDQLEVLAQRAARAELATTAVAALAHDLNHVLQVAMLAIAHARRHEGPIAARALDDAGGAVSSAAQMMRQLLALGRGAVAGAAQVDVDGAVSALRHLLGRLAAHATLSLALAAHDVEATISGLDLERILINLVVNAGQAMPDGGTITIATRLRRIPDGGLRLASGALAAGTYVELVVADDGTGIDPALVPRVFDAYVSTKGERGTGLGLASVLQLVRAAGGGVELESPPGGGTRVTVLLPVVRPAA
ncbi:MAG: GAF domain-containing protein [Kofleriaceae bacterium]|nr:GAF domain-containing protein [Kofleriaceae bacterium]MCL4223584.1 GAF domain-containing protein [Myxococcales bacterium]